MVAVPPVGVTRPSSIRRVVVLPAPLGPRKPVTAPCAHVEAEVVDGDDVAEALGEALIWMEVIGPPLTLRRRPARSASPAGRVRSRSAARRVCARPGSLPCGGGRSAGGRGYGRASWVPRDHERTWRGGHRRGCAVTRRRRTRSLAAASWPSPRSSPLYTTLRAARQRPASTGRRQSPIVLAHARPSRFRWPGAGASRSRSPSSYRRLRRRPDRVAPGMPGLRRGRRSYRAGPDGWRSTAPPPTAAGAV